MYNLSIDTKKDFININLIAASDNIYDFDIIKLKEKVFQ